MTTLATLAAVLLAVQAPPADAPKPAPAPAATTSDAPPAPEVLELLDRVERTGVAMKNLQAGVTWAKFDPTNDETMYRIGRLVIDGAGSGRRVAARFETLTVTTPEGQETSDIDERYVYENCWLWEVNAKLKSVKKRQVADEGTAYDPFTLGEGNLPLPMGQTRAAVLKEFDVTSCPVPDVRAFKGLENVQGLKLVPKSTSALRDEYRELQVFYSTDANGLAVLEGVHAVQKASTTTIRLRAPKINAALEDVDRENLKTPDLADRSWQGGWQIDVQRLAPAPADPAKESATGPATAPPAAAPKE
ncbi:MAG: hypothetical protein JNM94_04410 [Phycisphaerae bacterium]|nr:hypothetical protein [Phycisphaerae bacterium]